MKIYTGGGDKGQTSLVSGERVFKSNISVQAYGAVDELSSILGTVTAYLDESQEKVKDEICQIQTDLFKIGSLLATSPKAIISKPQKSIDEGRIKFLEDSIDKMSGVITPLKSFILPGGHVAAAWTHIARTVCRRVERRISAVLEESINKENISDYLSLTMVYINRLSDYFFTLARYINHVNGIKDTPLKK